MEDKLSKKEALKSQVSVKAVSSSVEIGPGGSHTFHAQDGRNYIVVITNIDDSYEATYQVYDQDWGHLAGQGSVSPFRSEPVTVLMTPNGVRVYNTSSSPSPGRPVIVATLYNI